VGLLATFHPKSAAADHRRRPVFRVQRHEKTH